MTSKNPTRDSYPYVTGMGFRNRCHMIFDEYQKDDPSKITADGQIVHVKTDYVPHFFSHVLPLINHKVVILTHNSSCGINESFSNLLNNNKVLKWYAQNANFHHDKLVSIPLGLANCRWPHGNIDLIKSVNNSNIEKQFLVYMNFDINTNVKERSNVFNAFDGKDFVLKSQRKPFKDYLSDLKASKFCISPPGAGIDCHRIWESIAVGTIPIVENCHNVSFHSKMPIMIIEDWNQVTEDYLEHKYDFFQTSVYDKSPLYLDYWIKKIGLKEIKNATE